MDMVSSGNMSELDLAAGMMAAPNIRLERVLRQGGMGSVWVADHLSLKTKVAVKFMLLQQSKSEEASTRFSREASAAAQIKSPHVVQVFDHGVNDKGMAYIVMEFLEGEDLGTRLQRKTSLPLPEVTAIVTQAAKALSKAHTSGVVHRDIKPDNIFLMDVDGELFVKVLDFGVAKTTVEKAMNMTSTGVMMGTPFYMAPEQMANAKNAVPQSDLWSLGVVAYEALTGKLPFQGETVAGLAIAVERGKYAPATEAVPALPKAINAWFEKILVREPEKRFATARELGEELNQITHPGARRAMPSELSTSMSDLPIVNVESVRGRPPTQMGATLDGAPKSRKRGLAVIAGVAALVVAVGVALFVLKGKGTAQAAADPPKASAETQAAAASTGPAVEVTPKAVPPEAASAAVSATASASAKPLALGTASASAAPVKPVVPVGPVQHPYVPPTTPHHGHGF
jgi:serine/threonine protein kinase